MVKGEGREGEVWQCDVKGVAGVNHLGHTKPFRGRASGQGPKWRAGEMVHRVRAPVLQA